MSNKLFKGPNQNGKPGLCRIDLPFPEEIVAGTVTVIVMKNNTIELFGQVMQEEVGSAILKAGLARLEEWHKERKAAASADIITPSGVEILGPDGNPLRPS
jgi:hypothetical protein